MAAGFGAAGAGGVDRQELVVPLVAVAVVFPDEAGRPSRAADAGVGAAVLVLAVAVVALFAPLEPAVTAEGAARGRPAPPGQGPAPGDKAGRYGAFLVGSLADTARLLTRTPELVTHKSVEEALAVYGRRADAPAAKAGPARQILRQLRDSRERTNALLSSGIDQKFAFLSGGDETSKAVRAKYGIGSNASPQQPGPIAAFAAQAIKNNLAQFVSVGFMANGCDTHGGSNAAHMGSLYPALTALSALVDDLASSPAPAPLKGTWLDNTTICVFSEFARTPMPVFTGTGRDHHFTNSCLLIGAGVRGGAVAGGSTETGGMQPRVYDFDTQEPLGDAARPNADKQRYIVPEDVGATLLASAGLDYAEYRFGKPLWPILTTKPF